MARVSLIINANSYDVACADGEEQNIKDLAATLDAKVSQLIKSIGQAGESRLLVMAGLLMADELADAHQETIRLQTQIENKAQNCVSDGTENHEKLAQRIESLAQYIENIAQQVEEA